MVQPITATPALPIALGEGSSAANGVSSGVVPIEGLMSGSTYAQMAPDFIATAPGPTGINRLWKNDVEAMLVRLNLTQNPEKTFAIDTRQFTSISISTLVGANPLQLTQCTLQRDAHGVYILPRTNKVAVEVPGRPGTFINLRPNIPYYINPATRILIWQDRLNSEADAGNLCFKEMICVQYEPSPKSRFHVTPDQEIIYTPPSEDPERLVVSRSGAFTINNTDCKEYQPDLEGGVHTVVTDPTYEAQSRHLFTITRKEGSRKHDISFVVNASGGIEVVPEGQILTTRLFLNPSERNQDDLLLTCFHQPQDGIDQNYCVGHLEGASPLNQRDIKPRHCWLYFQDGQWNVLSADASAVTKVYRPDGNDDWQIAPTTTNAPITLESGDRLCLGEDTWFEFKDGRFTHIPEEIEEIDPENSDETTTQPLIRLDEKPLRFSKNTSELTLVNSVKENELPSGFPIEIFDLITITNLPGSYSISVSSEFPAGASLSLQTHPNDTIVSITPTSITHITPRDPSTQLILVLDMNGQVVSIPLKLVRI